MQKHIFSLFWQSAMQYPFRTIGALLLSASTVVVASFLGPLIIADLLGKLQSGSLRLENAWTLIALYTAIQIYSQIIGWRLVNLAAWTMETAAQRDLYRQIFSNLTAQSLNFHANRFGGSLVSQTSKIIGSFERFWDTIIFQVIPVVSSVVGAIIILSFVLWQYALMLAIISTVFAVSVFYGSRFLAIRNKEEAQASTAISGHVADNITNIATIKSYGGERNEQKSLEAKTSFWRQKSLSSMRGFLGISTVYSSLIATLNVVALIVAVWASQENIIAIGAVYLCITYTFTVAQQLWQMNGVMRNYNRIIGDAHDMSEILQLTPTISDKSTQKITVKYGQIKVQSITFAHDEDAETLFRDFSLEIKPGERVGIVGHSGSGKTTLTKLLLRFADVDKGAITIDDQDISQVTQESIRMSIAYVPQEPMLFHRSLRENISYGKPDATDKEIITAAKRANAYEFIKKLPEGLDTTVGERGVKLSGGQRQRIAIARAILKDAPILVLDEATSALDSESEKLIQDALEKLMKNRTSIVIAHRLSTIAKLDRIIVLDNGKIKEDGTHTELLAKNGTYAKLWSHQSGGFIEE